MKRCTKCGEEKPLDDFFRHRHGRLGRTSRCKVCTTEDIEAYRERNKEKVAARRRRYERERRQVDPEYRARRQETELRSYYKNHEKNLAGKKRWRDANKDKTAADWAAYYAENRDKVRAGRAERYDPEKKRLSRKPGETRRARERRRARLLDAFVADVDFDEILMRDLGICGICGEAIMELTIELDHTTPLAAGGTHEPDNCQLAHRSCNRRKGRNLTV